jgi:integral membrane protein
VNTFLSSPIGRLRLLGFLEGMTLILIISLGMPLKYFFGLPMVVKVIGPIHGGFFLVFVFYAFLVGIQENWSFLKVTVKLWIASFIPFGNFYVDRTLLKPLQDQAKS